MFTLIHQHPDFVVVNKSPGVSVHKDENEQAFVHFVEQSLNIEKLYLVHRLDKMTSGLLLLATSSQSCAKLAGLFSTRQISKYYLAISATKPKKKQGLVSGDMVKARRSAWKLLKSEKDPAITQFFSVAAGEGRRLFIMKPYTGKTHQIRVALNSLGSSICGDPIYQLNTASQFDRGYLHAFALQFSYNNESFSFMCDPSQSNELGELWHTDEAVRAIREWQTPSTLPWPTLPGRLTQP
jgi:tRNA pseudouridine32 synthase/23S rRNA pseudouridine746 synthase